MPNPTEEQLVDAVQRHFMSQVLVKLFQWSSRYVFKKLLDLCSAIIFPDKVPTLSSLYS